MREETFKSCNFRTMSIITIAIGILLMSSGLSKMPIFSLLHMAVIFFAATSIGLWVLSLGVAKGDVNYSKTKVVIYASSSILITSAAFLIGDVLLN